ncbi:MAG: tetratricopeptide repeat protein [Candidatus Zixiibacteriota bacterium]
MRSSIETKTNGKSIGKYLPYLFLILMAAGIVNSCVYYNTFYLARKNFNQAESARRSANRDEASGGEIKGYQDAIKKASKVLSEHPTSNWVDDALFVIGKSFYYLGDFAKGERKFRELLSNFPDSKYADESRFFLGKSRYRLENYVQAMEIFIEFIETGKNDEWRAEAMYLMGEMSEAQELNAEAIDYYQKFVAEYKSHYYTPSVYYKIGQLQYESEDYADAAESYAHAAATAQEVKARYDARYEQGRALYMIDSVRTGMAIFEELKSEQQDSVFLGYILLRIAEGTKLLGEEREAILLYDDIATNFKLRLESAEAYFRLGQLAQEDWGDLVVAKDMYEMAAKEQRGGEWRTRALDKVSDIKKVETYMTAMSSDSAGAAALNRYLLAEMYRTDLNRPDSALQEYSKIVDKYPESELAPRSLLAMGWILENHFQDTTKAHAYYQRVVDDYPRSDALQRAVELLDLQGAEPYEFSPDKLYQMAENQLFEVENLDSAKVLFQRIVEEFPNSRLVPKAEFAVAKIQLQQFVPSTKPIPMPVDQPNPSALSDSTISLDSNKLPIMVDTLSATRVDSSGAVILDSAKTTPAIDSPAIPGVVDSTKIATAADSNKFQPGRDSANANATDSIVRMTDLIGGKNGDSAKTPTAGDSTGAANADSDQMLPKGDSAKAAANDNVVRLSDVIGRKNGVPIDTMKAATRRDSLLAAMAAKNDTSVFIGLPDSAQGPVPNDTLVAAGDSTKPAKSPADTLAVTPAKVEPVFVDSTMIYVFRKLAAKYPGTDIGEEASRLASGSNQPINRYQQQQQALLAQQQQNAARIDSTTQKDSIQAQPNDTLTEAQIAEQTLKEEIDLWPLMDDEPTVTGEFVYPVEASTSKFEGRVVLKIKIEFDGKVSEVIFLKGSNIKSIDEQVEKAMLLTYFDPLSIEPLKIGKYFIYNYEITLPEVYR